MTASSFLYHLKRALTNWPEGQWLHKVERSSVLRNMCLRPPKLIPCMEVTNTNTLAISWELPEYSVSLMVFVGFPGGTEAIWRIYPAATPTTELDRVFCGHRIPLETFNEWIKFVEALECGYSRPRCK